MSYFNLHLLALLYIYNTLLTCCVIPEESSKCIRNVRKLHWLYH